MVSLLLTSLALLCWPDDTATIRLRRITGRSARKRLRRPRPNAATVLVAAGATGWLTAGAGGAIATTLLAATARSQLEARTRSRQSLIATDALAEALRSLVAGLRAGAHPAKAAESAAEDTHPQAAATMRAVAAAARMDGDLTAVAIPARSLAQASALSRLTTAWQLAHRHGLPLADVLDAVRRDLEQRARFTRQVLARMTGPKSSALALSVLPVLGIALGTLMGAHPLTVLVSTAPGQLLLVAGVLLLCAGVTWSTRITNRAVHG